MCDPAQSGESRARAPLRGSAVRRSSPLVPVAYAPSEELAEGITLELASAGIVSRAMRRGGMWTVCVRARDVAHAKEILAQREATDEIPRAVQERWPRTGLVLALLLVFAHLVALWVGHDAVVHAAGCSGHLLRQGQLFRVLTALFVHANVEHLMGNAVAIAVLASGMVADMGVGSGLAVLLLSAGLGNLASGLLRGDYVLTIGASTAVFAAVGVLAMRQCFRHLRAPSRRLKAWIPLGAAASLLSMLGAGPHTDLSAHLWGLLAGVLGGVGHAAFGQRRAPPAFEGVLAVLALLLVVGAWWAVIAHR